MNAFRFFNTTNLHAHGLHVSPTQDNVFARVPPGANLTYSYFIPTDHAPGAFWYHSHYHGATAIQIMGGLVGALIVDAEPGALPAWLAALPEQVLLLQNLVFRYIGVAAQGHPAPSFALLESAAYNFSGGFTGGYTADASYSAPATYTVNGLVSPTLSLAAGSSTVLRIIYASAAETPTISLQGGVNASCSMHVIALDVVYLTAPRSVAFVRLAPGSRADLVVGCAQPGAVNLSTTATIYSNLAQTLVALTITGTPAAPAPLPATTAVARPPYLADMTGVTPATFVQLSISQPPVPSEQPQTSQGLEFWIGMGVDCSAVNATAGAATSPAATSPGCPFGAFSGQRGTVASAYPAGAVQMLGSPAQATFFGAGQPPHPMHIHVNHFQIISIGSGLAADGFSVVGDRRDTINVGTGTDLSVDAGTVIRWWPVDFSGEVVVYVASISPTLFDPLVDAASHLDASRCSLARCRSLTPHPSHPLPFPSTLFRHCHM